MSDANFETARAAMAVSQLRTSGVADMRVVDAMKAVPREAFMPAGRAELAYIDTPVPAGEGRALNTPLVIGRLLTALSPQSGERALVVGAATGYSAAILAALGLDVTALETDEALSQRAVAALAGRGVKQVAGPLADGWADGAPYDIILVDGAVDHVPEALTAQLADGGRMAAGLLEAGLTRLAAGRKDGGAITLGDFADIETVILPGFEKPRGFIF